MISEMAKAFNEGCEARISGIPKERNNPYLAASQEWSSWRRGWDDVNRYWGKDAKWPIKPLPEV